MRVVRASQGAFFGGQGLHGAAGDVHGAPAQREAATGDGVVGVEVQNDLVLHGHEVEAFHVGFVPAAPLDGVVLVVTAQLHVVVQTLDLGLEVDPLESHDDARALRADDVNSEVQVVVVVPRMVRGD